MESSERGFSMLYRTGISVFKPSRPNACGLKWVYPASEVVIRYFKACAQGFSYVRCFDYYFIIYLLFTTTYSINSYVEAYNE